MPWYVRAYVLYLSFTVFPGELNFLLVKATKLHGKATAPRAVLIYFRQVAGSVFYFMLWGYFYSVPPPRPPSKFSFKLITAGVS